MWEYDYGLENVSHDKTCCVFTLRTVSKSYVWIVESFSTIIHRTNAYVVHEGTFVEKCTDRTSGYQKVCFGSVVDHKETAVYARGFLSGSNDSRSRSPHGGPAACTFGCCPQIESGTLTNLHCLSMWTACTNPRDANRNRDREGLLRRISMISNRIDAIRLVNETTVACIRHAKMQRSQRSSGTTKPTRVCKCQRNCDHFLPPIFRALGIFVFFCGEPRRRINSVFSFWYFPVCGLHFSHVYLLEVLDDVVKFSSSAKLKLRRARMVEYELLHEWLGDCAKLLVTTRTSKKSSCF